MKINKLLILSILLISSSNLVFQKEIHAQTSGCILIRNNMRLGSRDSSKNNEVTKLQNFLHVNDYMDIESTGYFGPITKSAVIKFQKSENIDPIGIVGPLTRSKINTINCENKLPEKPISIPETVVPFVLIETPTTTVITLPYNSSNFTNWIGVWGDVSTTSENILYVNANENTNGAQVILPNSKELSNYRFSAKIFVNQSTITLLSRYVDENNFLGCNFSGRYIEIIERLNGVSSIVAYTTLTDYPYSQFFNTEVNVSMDVLNNTVGCTLIGGESNLTYNKVSNDLLKGGVGIQTWVNTKGISKVTLNEIKITQI